MDSLVLLIAEVQLIRDQFELEYSNWILSTYDDTVSVISQK